MSAVTSEQLVAILEEKLEQKLARFKTTFDELKKSVVEAKELLSFTSKQYDALLKRLTVCEEENKKLRNENKTLQKTLDKLDTSLKSVTKSHFILLYSCTNFITSSFLLPFILFLLE